MQTVVRDLPLSTVSILCYMALLINYGRLLLFMKLPNRNS